MLWQFGRVWRITSLRNCLPLPDMFFWLWIVFSHRIFDHRLFRINICNIQNVFFACPIDFRSRLHNDRLQRIDIYHLFHIHISRSNSVGVRKCLLYHKLPRIHLCYFVYFHGFNRSERCLSYSYWHYHHHRHRRIYRNHGSNTDFLEHCHDYYISCSHGFCWDLPWRRSCW